MKKLKTKEELLYDFKKANKNRRLVLANRAGFDTPDEYRQHLINQISNVESNVTVHNVHILDSSASMTWYNGSDQTKFQAAKSGIEIEIAELQKETNVNYIQTLITFSSQGRYNLEYSKLPIKEAGFPLNVYHGNTALYDAIVETLSNLLDNKKDNEKVIVKIFTDGRDNDSNWGSLEKAKKLINICKRDNITVTFVGTEKDVRHVISVLKIDESNTLSHKNDTSSIKESFEATTRSTKTYASKVLRGEDVLTGFYKQSGTI